MQRGVVAVRVNLAMDESNHGRDPEVVSGVFSTIKEDAKLYRTGGRKRMSSNEAREFFAEQRRVWRIATFPREKIAKYDHVMLQAAPLLVKDFMGVGELIEINLNFLLDGTIRNSDRLVERVARIPGVHVESVVCFPKKRRSFGSYNYAELIRAADYIAHTAYKNLYSNKILNYIEVKRGGLII